VTMAAVALENAFLQCDELENEYFQTIAGYEKDDLNRMARLLAERPAGRGTLRGHFESFHWVSRAGKAGALAQTVTAAAAHCADC